MLRANTGNVDYVSSPASANHYKPYVVPTSSKQIITRLSETGVSLAEISSLIWKWYVIFGLLFTSTINSILEYILNMDTNHQFVFIKSSFLYSSRC